MPAMEEMPAKVQRNTTLASDRIAGMTYREMAKKHSIDIGTVSRVLNRVEIKDIVDQGMIEVISRIPKGINVIDQALGDYKNNPSISLKASDMVLKVATIAPSNVENQTINNIVNVQNNITLNPNVAKNLGRAFNNNDEDVMEAEINE